MTHGTGDRGSFAVDGSGRNNPGSDPGALIEAIVHPGFAADRRDDAPGNNQLSNKIETQKPVRKDPTVTHPALRSIDRKIFLMFRVARAEE
jgi:hypothetical protein